MEKKKGLLLTSKRRIKVTSGNFEPAVDALMRTPIKFEPEPMIPEIKIKTEPSHRIRPSTSLSPKTHNKEFMSEYMNDGRRRAFEKYFENRAKATKAALDREWRGEERLRRWRTQKAIRETKPKYKKRDDKIIETIIQRRNEHYLLSAKADQTPFKLTVQSTRYVDDDILTNQPLSARPATVQSKIKFLN